MTNNEGTMPTPIPSFFDNDESRAYVKAVANAPFHTIAQWVTAACTECDMEPIAEGTEAEHCMIGDWVIIGCEGYFLVNPAAVGIDREFWMDWTDTEDPDAPMEPIRHLAHYANDRLGWAIVSLPPTEDDKQELRELLAIDPMISPEEREKFLKEVDELD